MYWELSRLGRIGFWAMVIDPHTLETVEEKGFPELADAIAWLQGKETITEPAITA